MLETVMSAEPPWFSFFGGEGGYYHAALEEEDPCELVRRLQESSVCRQAGRQGDQNGNAACAKNMCLLCLTATHPPLRLQQDESCVESVGTQLQPALEGGEGR